MKRFQLFILGLCLLTALPAFSQTKPTRDALISAASSGNLATVKTLVESNPELLGGTEYQTPLGAAIGNSHLEVVQFLLEKGADPNAPSQNSTPLAQALQRYDEKWKPLAEALVAKGAAVNGLDDDNGQTPLMLAISRGGSDRQKDRVQWLIDKGADVNALNRNGQSVFDLALSNANGDVLALLVAKIDPKKSDDNGNTALLSAVRANKPEVVSTLLTRGALVNAQNAMGDSPLHLAARGTGNAGFNAPLLKILVDAGANANLANARGDLPLHLALKRDISLDRTFNSQSGDFPVLPDQNAAPRGLQLVPLLEKTDINARDSGGFSPLALAIAARDVETRDLIRDRAPKTDSTTALFDAIAGGETAKTSALLTAKPFLVFFRLPDGSTPLHIASLWGTLGAAQELAKRGADINARDGRGLTPLHYALKNPTARFLRRSRNIATFLIEKGAGVNISTPEGDTALHFAARAADAELCNLLLTKNAKINLRNQSGESPLSLLTTKSADIALYKTFLQKGADPNARIGASEGASFRSYNGFGNYYGGGSSSSVLGRAVSARRLDLVRLLLENGAKVDGPGTGGNTPLAQTISSYYNSGDSAVQTEIALFLLEKGANPAARVERNDLLAQAIERGNVEIVKAMLATKKVSLKSTRGRTSPLYSAANNGRVEMVKVLLEAGADPSETDQYNRTPLQGAQNEEIKKLLNDKIAQIAAEKAKNAPAPKTDAPVETQPAEIAPVVRPANGGGPIF